MKIDWLRRVRVAAIMGVLAIICSPVCADFLVSQNLGDSHYTASSSYSSQVGPRLAFDGDHGSAWNAGTGPAQWAEVDLGALYTLDRFQIDLSRSGQPGWSTHEVWVSSSPIGYDRSHATLAYTFNAITQDHALLETTVSPYLTGRYVQFRTTAVASWVAFYECQVFAVPEPSSILAVLCGIGCLGGFVRGSRARSRRQP